MKTLRRNTLVVVVIIMGVIISMLSINIMTLKGANKKLNNELVEAEQNYEAEKEEIINTYESEIKEKDEQLYNVFNDQPVDVTFEHDGAVYNVTVKGKGLFKNVTKSEVRGTMIK